MKKRFVLCLLTLVVALDVMAKERPNVLFIMSDDHGAGRGRVCDRTQPLQPYAHA